MALMVLIVLMVLISFLSYFGSEIALNLGGSNLSGVTAITIRQVFISRVDFAQGLLGRGRHSRTTL